MAKKELVIFESDREVSMDEIREHCECNDMPVPEEDSHEYWSIVNNIREWDTEDFLCNAAGYKLNLGPCLIHGYAGLWYGHADGGKFVEINGPRDLVSLMDNCDEVKVVIDPDDGLVVYGYHHDGTNRYIVTQLTKRGIAYVDNHGKYNTREYHNKILTTRGLTKKVKNIFDF